MKNSLYLFRIARGYIQPQAIHFHRALLDNRYSFIDDKLSHSDDLLNAPNRTIILLEREIVTMLRTTSAYDNEKFM